MASKLFLFLLVLLACVSHGQAVIPISSCTELQAMNNNLAEHYQLSSNTDCSATSSWNAGEGLEPIGSSAAPFAGTFDGQGYEISGLLINRPTMNYVGLFGYTNSNAHIQSVNLPGGSVSGYIYVAILIGYNAGTISNVTTSGSVTSSGSNVGGLVGSNTGTLSNAAAACSVTSSGSNLGGLVGSNTGTLSNVIATGSLIGTGTSLSRSLGGLVGYNAGPLSNVTATGNVAGGASKYVGGLVGHNTVPLNNASATGSVASSGYYVGGLVGYNFGPLSNVYATGDVTGGALTYYLGGLVGTNTALLSNTYATGNVATNSGYYVGGLVGQNSNTGEINNVYATGSVASSGNYVGGLVGHNTGFLANTYASGSVTTSGNYFGGLMGHNSGGGTLSNGYWDTQTSGQSTSAGGGGTVGKSTTQMYQQATFQGFDFECVWTINEGVSYPELTFADCSHRTITVMTCTELQEAVALMGASIILGQDIDCADTANWNGGAGFLPGTGLTSTGAFWGQGYSISGLVVNRTSTSAVGLFASIGTLVQVDSVRLLKGSISGDDYVGSLVGKSSGTISNVYAASNVTGSGNYAGGLIGRNYGDLSNVYASGSVICSGNYAGGLIGQNYGDLSNIYASGSVICSGVVGGLVSSNTGILSNGYWDTQTSGQSTSAGGGGTVGKSTTQMYQQATFQGFDFECVWTINEGLGYPELTFAHCSNRTITVMTCIELQEAVALMGATIILAQDIDCTDTVNWNDGAGFLPGTGLTASGAFWGQGYSISRLVVNRTATSSVGLFVSIGALAQVDTVSLLGGSVSGDDYVGSLVGKSSGTISNVYVTGNVTGSGNYIGGLVGRSSGTVSNVYITSNVTGSGDYIAGLVGYNDLATINNVTASGSVTASGRYVGGLVGSNSGPLSNISVSGSVTGSDYFTGGLVGYNNLATINNVTASGSVTASGRYVGGLLGSNSGSLSNVYASGNVQGSSHIGGLVGSNSGELLHTYATGNVVGSSDYVGGLLGTNGSPLSNAYATGNVNGSNKKVGGLVGSNSGPLSNVYATGNVVGSSDYVGGLVGSNSYYLENSAPISNAYASGNVTSSGSYIGGLLGYNDQTPLNNLIATGNVTGTGDYVGGLIGYNIGTISNVYAATGAVAGSSAVGGLMGWNFGSLTNAYASGSVTGSDNYVGGLVGNNTGNLTHVYATGNVTGSSSVGGLVGYNSQGTLSNGYWDIEASGISTSDGGTARTTTQMKYMSSYVNWDFTEVWLITCDSYPLLRVFSTSLLNRTAYINQCSDFLSFCPNEALLLTQDVDCTDSANWNNGAGFPPASFYLNSTLYQIYSGTFDGQAHSIYNLTINRPNDDKIGLFPVVNGSAEIKNVNLIGVNILGNKHVGGIVGILQGGLLSSVSVTGKISGASIVAGITGTIESGTIVNAYFVGDISGSSTVAGLVAVNQAGVVRESYAATTLSGNNVGALVATNNLPSSVIDSYWDLEVSEQFITAGGGTPRSSDEMRWQGNYEGWDFNQTWCMGCHHYPALQGNHLCSNIPAAVNVSDCHALQQICLYQDVYLTQDIDCSGSINWNAGKGFEPLGWYLDGTKQAPYSGELDGQGYRITGLYINRPDKNYVGLFGFLSDSAYIHDVAIETAEITGKATVGILAGRNDGTIVRVMVTGQLVGNGDQTGGLIGEHLGTLQQSYADVSILSTGSQVGGLVGKHVSGTINACYAIGPIAAFSSNIGGLVGSSLPAATTTYSYWDTGKTTQSSSASGTARTTGQMQSSTTYPGWDFGTTWQIEEGCQYPQLQQFAMSSSTPQSVNITDCDGLQALCPSQSAYLLRDIDCLNSALWNNGAGFQPIGFYLNEASNHPFSGILDGQGYAIHNLFMQRPTEDYVGLLGYTAPLAIIRNLRMEASDIIGRNVVGALVGFHQGTIENSQINVNLNGENIIGELVGHNTGTVSYCTSFGHTQGKKMVGGLVGNNTGNVQHSNAHGSASGATRVGGLIATNRGTVHNATSTSTVSGQSLIAGLVAVNEQRITDSTAAPQVTGTQTVGGLVASNEGSITNCRVQLPKETFDAKDTAGGLVGSNHGSVTNCQVTGTVNGETITGGIAGLNTGSLAWVRVNATVTGDNAVGGIVGHHAGELQQAASYGAVIGTLHVGGLVGEQSGSIHQCYTLSAVTGQEYIGGLVGQHIASTLHECYAAGCVNGKQQGGLVGSQVNEAQLAYCYWDEKTSGQWLPASHGRYYDLQQKAGKTTHALYRAATYEEWDFTVWQIEEGKSYPYLPALESIPPRVPDIACPSSEPAYQSITPVLSALTGIIGGLAMMTAALLFLGWLWQRQELKRMQTTHPLHHAAYVGDAALCQYWLSQGSSPLEKNNEQRTPLTLAAAAGHLEAIKALLKKIDPQKTSNLETHYREAVRAANDCNHQSVITHFEEVLSEDHVKRLLTDHSQNDDKEDNEDMRARLVEEKKHLPNTINISFGLTQVMRLTLAHAFLEARRVILQAPNLFIRSRDHKTAVRMAVEQGNRAAAQLWINASTDQACWAWHFDAIIAAATQLTEVDLSGHMLSDGKLYRLAMALKDSSVTCVKLNANNLTSLGVWGWINEVGLPAQLQTLDLTHNRIDELGASALQNAVSKQTTLTVKLEGNPCSVTQIDNSSTVNQPFWAPLAALFFAVRLLLAPFPLWSMIGFFIEMLERIATLLLLQTLLEERAPRLAGNLLLVLIVSYVLNLYGMRWVRGHWQPQQKKDIPYWLLTLPIISPEWSRLEWRLTCADWEFVAYKLTNVCLESMLPYVIAQHFMTELGAEQSWLKLYTAPFGMAFALSKFALYDWFALPPFPFKAWFGKRSAQATRKDKEMTEMI